MKESIKKIVILEDEMIIALDIASRLRELGYEVMQILGHSDKAIDYLSFHTPDLLLCDIRINGANDGIDVVKAVQKKRKFPVVFLTSMSDIDTLNKAKKVLPYGYIVKPFTSSDLSASIEVALFKFQSELDLLLLSKDKLDKILQDPLTDIEFNYLKDITHGLTNNEISEKYYVSINTVKSHLRNLMKKLNCHNRAELMNLMLNLFGIQR